MKNIEATSLIILLIAVYPLLYRNKDTASAILSKTYPFLFREDVQWIPSPTQLSWFFSSVVSTYIMPTGQNSDWFTSSSTSVHTAAINSSVRLLHIEVGAGCQCRFIRKFPSLPSSITLRGYIFIRNVFRLLTAESKRVVQIHGERPFCNWSLYSSGRLSRRPYINIL